MKRLGIALGLLLTAAVVYAAAVSTPKPKRDVPVPQRASLMAIVATPDLDS